ncbi:MAG: hypothetical protein JSV86_03305 [Gemmatimonadota bacterium]|nr:MAG: hypothetical protein JSV86_03305 [Gemmatimonadota bacterium]
MLGTLHVVQSSSGGLALMGYLLLGLAIVIIGGAVLLALFRRSAVTRRDPEAERLDNLKDQIIWRALGQGTRVTAAEVAAQSGLTEADAELALMALVSEGRAVAEPGESGGVIYRIGSAAAGGS